MFYGLLVIGPPGAGKTTFCYGIYQFLTGMDLLEREQLQESNGSSLEREQLREKNGSDGATKVGRKVAMVNLDPGNECVPYVPDIDVRTIADLSDVMRDFSLGPNGATLKCMELLDENVDWLLEELYAYAASGFDYFVFDCPGQVELYTHHGALAKIVARLGREDNYLSKSDHLSLTLKLVTVNLIDSLYCSDPGKYVAATLTSLTAMLHLETPHVNLMSKVDLLLPPGSTSSSRKSRIGSGTVPPEPGTNDPPAPSLFGARPDFDLSYYTDVLDLSYLIDGLDDDAFFRKYKKLNAALCGIIEDYSLVSYVPCDINDKKCMLYISKLLDRAIGYTPFLTNSDHNQNESSSSGDANTLPIGEGTLHFPDIFNPPPCNNRGEKDLQINLTSSSLPTKAAEDIVEEFIRDVNLDKKCDDL